MHLRWLLLWNPWDPQEACYQRRQLWMTSSHCFLALPVIFLCTTSHWLLLGMNRVSVCTHSQPCPGLLQSWEHSPVHNRVFSKCWKQVNKVVQCTMRFRCLKVAPETCSLTSPPTSPTDVYQIVPSGRDQLHNGNNTPKMFSNDLDKGANEIGSWYSPC